MHDWLRTFINVCVRAPLLVLVCVVVMVVDVSSVIVYACLVGWFARQTRFYSELTCGTPKIHVEKKAQIDNSNSEPPASSRVGDVVRTERFHIRRRDRLCCDRQCTTGLTGHLRQESAAKLDPQVPHAHVKPPRTRATRTQGTPRLRKHIPQGKTKKRRVNTSPEEARTRKRTNRVKKEMKHPKPQNEEPTRENEGMTTSGEAHLRYHLPNRKPFHS